MYQKYVELLAKHNTTTYQVCKATGIPESTISMWKTRASEDKDATIRIYDLKKIAEYFGVSVDYFLEE